MEKFIEKVGYVELSNYELESNRLSYRTLVNKFIDNKVLCNDFYKVDGEAYYNIKAGSLYWEGEDGEVIDHEVDQTFITDIDNYMLEKLQELGTESIIIGYSNVLDVYLLFVTHCDTGWDYVLTDVKIDESKD